MFTTAMLHELYAHMQWADAEFWKAALSRPAAARDEKLIAKLTHIHMTQRAFLAAWTGTPQPNYGEKFASLPELLAWARPFYGSAATFLASLRDERLGESMNVPWARRFVTATGREPGATTLGETLYQLAAHTQYHRAQVNMMLRNLGGEPPLVDYIAWLWLGRPPAVWPA